MQKSQGSPSQPTGIGLRQSKILVAGDVGREPMNSSVTAGPCARLPGEGVDALLPESRSVPVTAECPVCLDAINGAVAEIRTCVCMGEREDSSYGV